MLAALLEIPYKTTQGTLHSSRRRTKVGISQLKIHAAQIYEDFARSTDFEHHRSTSYDSNLIYSIDCDWRPKTVKLKYNQKPSLSDIKD